MKLYIGPYIYFLGPYQIAEKILFWKDKDKDDSVHNFGEWLATNSKGEDSWLMKVCQWIHSKQKRKIKIKIDSFDSWNADHTLSLIALPLLKQLKEQKKSAPWVDDEDVPEEIRSTSAKPKENEYDIDEFHFARWDYVLDCMIWSFEQHANDDQEEDKFFHWDDTQQAPEGSVLNDLGIGRCKIDKEGFDAYHARKQRGFVLFGKYLRNWWS